MEFRFSWVRRVLLSVFSLVFLTTVYILTSVDEHKERATTKGRHSQTNNKVTNDEHGILVATGNGMTRAYYAFRLGSEGDAVRNRHT